MNMQKSLMVVATTAVGFAVGLYVYVKFIKAKGGMVSNGAASAPSMPIPTASSSPDMGL